MIPMQKSVFLSAAVLGLALAGPGFAQTPVSPTGSEGTGSASPAGRSHINKGQNVTPDGTSGASNYTGQGRMGTKSVGRGTEGSGGPSEKAGSGGPGPGSTPAGQPSRP